MSDTMQNSQPKTLTRQRSEPKWSTDLVAVGAAVVCVVVMWLCLAVWSGVDLTVTLGEETREIQGVAVVMGAAVAGLLGVGTLRLLERIMLRALQIWTVIAIAVTLVSALGPLSATSAAATGVLLAMHAIVAVVLIVSMHRIRRR
ncbi:DUF6069 family protein [Ornithinimicrobium sp. F0845]|uniref:DUF6069 family protein n=1 Tax=Ornithinimicrobium sp. F0845 TaxID=2926412 RepID=UPI001FF5C4BB|nr:DUF6069 family protein [Ornithinimicrobium sp. F0845]MCK0112978.1 DUF6069 family protein [Ornithinimicrobium sp. F0845]